MGSAVPIRKVLPNLPQMVEEYLDERSLDLAPATHKAYASAPFGGSQPKAGMKGAAPT